MNSELRNIADNIIDAAIKAVLPDAAVKRALDGKEFKGKVILVSVGKAAWQMAMAASDCMGDRIDKGVVITKYGHVKGEIENVLLTGLNVLKQVIQYLMRIHLGQRRQL